jgi:hypothetical protein
LQLLGLHTKPLLYNSLTANNLKNQVENVIFVLVNPFKFGKKRKCGALSPLIDPRRVGIMIPDNQIGFSDTSLPVQFSAKIFRKKDNYFSSDRHTFGATFFKASVINTILSS